MVFSYSSFKVYWIEQKGITFDRDFWYSFSSSSSIYFLGKRKGEKNNESRGQTSCISARSFTVLKYGILTSINQPDN